METDITKSSLDIRTEHSSEDVSDSEIESDIYDEVVEPVDAESNEMGAGT